MKIKEAYHYDKNNKLIGKYDRITSNDKKFNPHYFVSKFTIDTSQKLVEYYENPEFVHRIYSITFIDFEYKIS